VAVTTLIVEDSLAARNVLKQRLTEVGCAVIGEADHAAQGPALFRSLLPKLVTLDLLMPTVDGMDAKSLFRIIRAEAPDVAVILISSQAKKNEEAKFLGEGAMAYFQKPFIDARALAEKLRQIFPELTAKNG